MAISIDGLTHKGKTARLLFAKWVLDGVFGEVPRMIFGNSAGMRNNIGPLLHSTFTRIKGGGSTAFSSSTHQRVGTLKTNGFVVTEPPYEQQMINDLIQKYQTLIRDDDVTRPNGKYSVEVKDPLQTMPELKLLFVPGVKDVLHAYFGSSFRVIETQLFRNFPIPDWDRELEAYSDFWHCDSYPTPWLKVYVLLSDWTLTDGPTEIIPIRETKQIMRSGYVNRYFSTFGKEGLAKRTAGATRAVGPAGSVFFFNPQRCLHRAGIPDAGRQRDAVMFFVSGISGPNDEI